MSDAVTEPQFDVISDGGLDAYAELNNRVEVAPFSLNFGSETRLASDFTREDFFRRLKAGTPHPTTSQPTPQAYVTLLEQAVRPMLAVTISSGLSGSLNAAEQARTLVPRTQTTLHDSRTLSAAQAFQVHAAMTARQMGHSIQTALDWMQRVGEQTELYFTIETLEYLKRGGRIGRVQATLGGLLNLKPVVTVDKKTGAYTNVGRARAWKGALEAVANQVTSRYGEGTPLRLGLLYGETRDSAEIVLAHLRGRHPIVWSGFAPVNPVLAVHTGPSAVGLAAAPGGWPWES
ncbi:DegV family protein [Deinococcus ruber]|uniref:DegV domain-containing protein n=1 Tax=Deinococcus ruber TaxID=1848197 RepID=A0A918FDD3_9DEIO|nr:DegV family protein [Deinococcus ruber]GGR24812.1 DegV domain-containing protein [Deinococcus ruber]